MGATFALSLMAVSPRLAEANGRSPMSVSVHLREGSDTDLASWTTWGLLISRDGGGFRWMCETALKVGGAFDPDIVFRADGSMLATSFEGLLLNRDGCLFDPTGLGTKFVTRVAQGGDGAIHAAVIELGDVKIYKSTDGAQTFPISASVDPTSDWWESLEVAPSNPSRLYLSGFAIDDQQVKTFLMFRSVDGGASYQPIATPQPVMSRSSDLKIAAVSPTNPDLLFARVTYATGDTLGDRIYRSVDGGASWGAPVLSVADSINGFVIRKNGEILAATSISGTWRSTDGGATFAPLATSLQVQCLAERANGTLVACAQNFEPDNMSLGTSTDGLTWTKLFRFSEAIGPVDCAVGTLQCDTCQLSMWCELRTQFGITADPTTCELPGGDGSVCGGPLPPDPDPPSDGGCCGTSGNPGSLLLGSFVLLALFVLRRR